MADTAYVVEWGAISLPLGHPSRVTCMEVHRAFSEAAAAAEACDFDARVFPITIPDPANEPGFVPVAEVHPSQKLSELHALLRQRVRPLTVETEQPKQPEQVHLAAGDSQSPDGSDGRGAEPVGGVKVDAKTLDRIQETARRYMTEGLDADFAMQEIAAMLGIPAGVALPGKDQP